MNKERISFTAGLFLLACGPNPNRVDQRLYVGTGEYLQTQDWHALLRMEHIQELEDETKTPEGFVNVQQTYDDNGVGLNFVHSLAVHEGRDELYAASTFTHAEESDFCDAQGGAPEERPRCGSIAIFLSASTLGDASEVARHLWGPATGLNQPHGVWIDEATDHLYVSNTFANNVAIWDDASTADGDQAPDRLLDTTAYGLPVHAFVEPTTDRLFVALMPGPGEPGEEGGQPSVAIYHNAASVTGTQAPDLLLQGDATRLGDGNNQTTHNVWYDAASEVLFVGHHTNEILLYDTSQVDWEAAGSPAILNLAPEVLEIHEEDDGSDQYDWSAYGLFYVAELDRLFVAAGATSGVTTITPVPRTPVPRRTA